MLISEWIYQRPKSENVVG